MRISSMVWGLVLLSGMAACDNSGPTPKADRPASAAVTTAASSKPAAVVANSARTRGPLPQKPKAIAAPPDVAAPPADAKKTKSGLAFKILNEGKGDEKPSKYDSVRVHYTGWTKDGKMFDSSVMRGQPAMFRVGGVIKGWTEGLQLMTKGEKRRFWIPANLAYGERTKPGTPSGQLTFDVQLIDIKPGPKPPPVPEDLLKPPADAKKTASGLVYRYLKKGKGDKSPSSTDYVTVHYSGWTKDGEMFDSSLMRQRPQTFQVGSLIKGWTEGLQLMKQGDSVRMWIPSKLAYGDKPERKGAPAGDLVFDVELIGIRAAPRGRGHGHGPGSHAGHGH